MSVKANITDGKNGLQAGVHPAGYLKTGPVQYNTAKFNALDNTGTAYSYIDPTPNCQAVIAGVLMTADRNVSGTTGAVVRIYEADAPDSTTASKVLLTTDILKNDGFTALGTNILVTPSVWVNADTDDATINLTLLYYYIDVNEDA